MESCILIPYVGWSILNPGQSHRSDSMITAEGMDFSVPPSPLIPFGLFKPISLVLMCPKLNQTNGIKN